MEQTFCLDELISLQEKRELKETEGPGDSLSSQSFAERFWYLHLDLMPQLFLLLCPSEDRQNLAPLQVHLVVHGMVLRDGALCHRAETASAMGAQRPGAGGSPVLQLSPSHVAANMKGSC